MHYPDAITLVYLPDGPMAYFKLTSIELTKQIYVSSPSISPLVQN
jgi:ribosome production factor 1